MRKATFDQMQVKRAETPIATDWTMASRGLPAGLSWFGAKHPRSAGRVAGRPATLAIAAVAIAAFVLAGCTGDDSDANEALAGERLDQIERDPGFSAQPPNTNVHRTTRTDECVDEGADWGGLGTSRLYRTQGASDDAYRFVLRRLGNSGWSLDRERVPVRANQTFLTKDFGSWTAQVSVRSDQRGYVDVSGSLDEEGICY